MTTNKLNINVLYLPESVDKEKALGVAHAHRMFGGSDFAGPYEVRAAEKIAVYLAQGSSECCNRLEEALNETL